MSALTHPLATTLQPLTTTPQPFWIVNKYKVIAVPTSIIFHQGMLCIGESCFVIIGATCKSNEIQLHRIVLNTCNQNPF